MKRYEVVTWSQDIGSDEHLDFDHFTDALKHAKSFRKSEEYAAIYDTENRIAFVVFGDPSTRVFIESVKTVTVA